jgi:hypothetical protein
MKFVPSTHRGGNHHDNLRTLERRRFSLQEIASFMLCRLAPPDPDRREVSVIKNLTTTAAERCAFTWSEKVFDVLRAHEAVDCANAEDPSAVNNPHNRQANSAAGRFCLSAPSGMW